MRLRSGSRRRSGDDSGGTSNGRLGFTFAPGGGRREGSWDSCLALSGGAGAAAAVLGLLLLLVACPILFDGVVLLRGRRGCTRGAALGRGAAGPAGGAGPLQPRLHLADACLEGFEFRGLRVDLLLPAVHNARISIVLAQSHAVPSHCWWRRGWAGGVLQCMHLRGWATTDRLSTFSSRSATLLSMRKMSISSCENIWAMVLHWEGLESAGALQGVPVAASRAVAASR